MRRLSLFKRTHPLSDGTWTYTWERGRQLKSMSKSGATWNFTYDADGLRTKRTDGANTYLYYYDGGLLRCMEYNGVKMFFTYDAQGMPVSMTYNGATYYYALNLQGDVMAILNASSAAVVNYNYNAWGELLSTTGSLANTIGLYNPLRYRGYIYDRETGLYYLQSRYYNPEICRFINADNRLIGNVLGNNLYAYSINNPVNYLDKSGHYAEAVNALQGWTVGMSWLPVADTILPIGDLIYMGGILLLGGIALEAADDYSVEIDSDLITDVVSPPSPDNDDDDDDDYFDDERNFAGRERVGRQKGKTPRSNKAQNEQFEAATKGLTKSQKKQVHRIITKKGMGYNDICKIVKELFYFTIHIF